MSEVAVEIPDREVQASLADASAVEIPDREVQARKAEASARVRSARVSSGVMSTAEEDALLDREHQQHLEAEARTLHQHAEQFNQQSAQWVNSFKGFHDSLKALGDVENWARSIESDMSFINSSLEQIQHAAEASQDQQPADMPDDGVARER